MIQTTQKLTFEEFLEITSRDRHPLSELVNGEIVELEPTRAHKNVSRHLVKCFDKEIDRLGLDYIVDKDIVIKTEAANGNVQGRVPDVSVVSKSLWNSNVFTYAALTEPPTLTVEVISTNWEDDYIDKLDEYQRLGISEYWIVDYLAIASRAYLGNPKLPTVFVYQLIDGTYQVRSFTGNARIVSPTFSQLELTVEQIVGTSNIHKL